MPRMAHQTLVRVISLLLVALMSVDAEDPIVHVLADTGGTCHYELKIPQMSCQHCKCQFDDVDTVIAQMKVRLDTIEKQIQQMIGMVPPEYEMSDYASTSILSSILEADPYASPVFTDEGSSEGGFSNSGHESPMSSDSEWHPAASAFKRESGAPDPVDIAGVLPANSPGFDGQIETAPGYEKVVTGTGLVPLNIPMPVHNQVSDFRSKTEGETTTSIDSEHFPGGLSEYDSRDNVHERQGDTSESADSGTTASSTDSTATSPNAQQENPIATEQPLIGDDTQGPNKKPRWRLHINRPAVSDAPKSRSVSLEPLGRAGPNCLDGCSCLRSWGYWQNGVYAIRNPPASDKKGETLSAYCDMSTDGGAWTVIQNRVDGSRNFYRRWSSYANGFGRLDTDFWIGNNMLHALTSRLHYQLRVEFRDWAGEEGYAVYDHILVGSKDEKYRLVLGKYVAGNRGDALSYHNNSFFSTHDQDNDASSEVNCAELRQAGFWFRACNKANPNGRYIHKADATGLNGAVITWGTWEAHGFTYALKAFRMMIRPVNFDRVLYYRQ